MSSIIEKPDIDFDYDLSELAQFEGWQVIAYDNDINTFDEVIHILQVATACTADEAYHETWEIHHYGKSSVHHGSRSECERAAGIIQSIGVRTEVVEE